MVEVSKSTVSDVIIDRPSMDFDLCNAVTNVICHEAMCEMQ